MKSLFCLLFLVVSAAGAQTLWHGRSTVSAAGFRLDRAKFSDQNSNASGIIFSLFGEFAAQPSTTVIVSVPFMQGSISTAFYADDQVTIGNPYVGVQFGSPASTVYGEFGVRLPLASDEKNLANSIGVLTDFENFEAYVPHLASLSAAADIETELSPSLWLLAKVGPVADVWTSGRSSASLYASYGATAQLRLDALALGLGYSARTLLSEETAPDRTMDYVAAGGSYRFSKIELGMQARYTMDEYLRRSMDLAYALSLRATL
jgi:hypothetical protein